MGFFDKKSKTNTTVQETSTNNVDNRAAQGENVNFGGNVSINAGVGQGSSFGGQGGSAALGAAGSGGDTSISVTTTDFGALDTAREISESAFSFASQSSASSLATVEEVAKDAVEVAESAARDEAARTTQMAIIGVAIVGVVFALRGTFKKVLS